MTAVLDTERTLASSVSGSRRTRDLAFLVGLWAALLLAVVTLVTLLVDTFLTGRSRLNWDFLTGFPSPFPDDTGIQSAIFGSIWVIGLTALISLPLGVSAAIYLEEFAHRERRLNRFIELNIQNLAGVPSIVYGILGLAFVARGALGWGFTVRTAALILSMVVLPTVVIASREAIRAVPSSLRQGALALGATQWQTVSRQVLPAAVPGIATGSILATSRALGESAPLLMVGALTFVTFNPEGFDSAYTVMPLQIFRYISEARAEFKPLAAASAVVLLVLLVLMNLTAVLVRNRFRRKW